jgi:hypothetical protein
MQDKAQILIQEHLNLVWHLWNDRQLISNRNREPESPMARLEIPAFPSRDVISHSFFSDDGGFLFHIEQCEVLLDIQSGFISH